AQLNALPTSVQEALFGAEALARIEEIEQRYGVQLMQPLAELATGAMPWGGFPNALLEQLPDREQVDELVDVVYRRILVGVLHEIDPSAAVEQVTVPEVVKHARTALSGVTLNERSVRRLESVVRQLLDGDTSRDEAVQLLTRVDKLGGIGVDVGQAEEFCDVVQDFERVYAQKTDSTKTAPAPNDALLMTDKEEQGIRQEHPVASTNDYSDTDEIIDKIIVRSGARFANASMERRFRDAMTSYLRGVRKKQQVIDVLSRGRDAGGIGLQEGVARKLVVLVDEVTGRVAPSVHRRAPSIAKPEKPPSREPIPVTPITRSPKPKPLLPPMPPMNIEALTAGVQPKALPGEENDPERLLPPARVTDSAPIATRAPAPPVRTPTPPPPATKQVPTPTPLVHETAKVVVQKAPTVPPRSTQSIKSVQRTQPIGKTKVQEVRTSNRRLIGPIEELERLAIDDFRKIGTNASDSARRIIEKVALLDRLSYAQRASGIRALRSSPLMTQYAEVLNEALASQRKVTDVLAKNASDPNALQPEEYRALQEVNEQLRV
ncbi:MAG: hypothetical protein ABIG71_02260, partial [Candidatus Uhrbacteria bacterium]